MVPSAVPSFTTGNDHKLAWERSDFDEEIEKKALQMTTAGNYLKNSTRRSSKHVNVSCEEWSLKNSRDDDNEEFNEKRKIAE
ncbi:unnamed protein product [Soboliphyme baturini]|uniref:Ovule protein n=1 Tax=Soboliphyme baturini TaxID=241478 RepID=A0A183ITV5_9BILA|nr:unnamed protein product [Soboliphyme baturini]